eukprot:278441-Pleurochrysis_carterae.AAC.1
MPPLVSFSESTLTACGSCVCLAHAWHHARMCSVIDECVRDRTSVCAYVGLPRCASLACVCAFQGRDASAPAPLARCACH